MLKTQKNICTGCTACYAICPVGAITMQENQEGFLYPIVDTLKCTQCNLCNIVCPALNKPLNSNFAKPQCYAGWNLNPQTQQQSSSGGVFSLLASQTLKQKGVVCGAVFNQATLIHQFAFNSVELEKMYGSKYVQSDLQNSFKKIKEYLNQNTPVLFSGTPCQVAGLYGFLQKPYSQLITIDLLCHAVPSPKIFKDYANALALNQPILEINFRDKEKEGWNNYQFKIKTPQRVFKENHKKNYFMQAFLKDIICRPSCATCGFNKLPRVADISLGDFWGIKKYNKKLDDNKGTSLILANNKKGEFFLNNIKNFTFLHKTPLKWAISGNPILKRPSPAPFTLRKAFFERYHKQENILSLLKDFLVYGNTNNPLKVGVMNFHFSNHNYGALMVPYALTKALENLGYCPEIINYIPKKYKKDFFKKNVFSDFRKNHLKLTVPCYNKKDLKKLNPLFSKFIVGSDQVWRWHDNYLYFLPWVKGHKKLISYAASFGTNNTNYTLIDKKNINQFLTRFDAISVREHSAIEVCNQLGAKAQKVLDPTLLLKAQDYEKLIAQEKPTDIKNQEEYVGCMFLNPLTQKHFKEILPFLQTLLINNKKPVFINVLKDSNEENRPFSHWLYLIKNSSFMLTDSFHGSVFSILFSKNFICTQLKAGGVDRLESLFKDLEINSELIFIKNLKQIKQENFNIALNYTNINRNLDVKREESFKFLKNSLQTTPVKKYPQVYGPFYEKIFNKGLFFLEKRFPKKLAVIKKIFKKLGF